MLPVVLSTCVSAFAGVLPAEADAAKVERAPAVREIEVVVDGSYRPDRITVTEGERVRLKFVRRDRSPCTREVVFAALGIRRELPTDQPVTIELPVLSVGTYEFHCGMNMTRGVLEVVARKP
ncbi:cupredoxin domain-containing protein [Nannocystis radixulma]|uniref:Cupredoxin domain-containing protein n=1 Tax=Nannocystis radixulma TaxID=2995305 RepID=A0ABT5BMM6_9BACT|nr:cupredoxin domain-containing protein [Nannocystis radixulma]MDC0675422.1 cupredoxin domain-containing protein [Nannocystis radixulma]